ncbi:hypothetical protein ABFU27_02650 [Xanthomonas campestris pv. raphani]|uniref:hypothetical protein n=1 Tax=Xanthomonas campestris TaxID=339 RepID=UPI00111589DC|nr:hypothetical protein [Xanthomonas campestris]MCC8686087.1 hypothetical protein [Xanthomonas campestris]MCC8692184.1 hypothetical protein [Xanthomonas campestris]MCF8825270.1 hypothetical protein [Xanthomonas campestris pv. raphani]MCW1998199.1 hypothetical protein [Xanthomonas campestris]MEA9677657.1 hypothetical protein [Xanthomonas campestris pv. raphani]
MRTKEQVVEVIQSAFAPLDCVAELHDYNTVVGFRVYGPTNEPLLKFKETSVDSLLSGPGLETIIDAARRKVEQKGFKLDPWVLPRT